jgi:hypothetical protein
MLFQQGGFVRIIDAVKGPKFPTPPPFPTYFPTDKAAAPPAQIYAPAPEADPLLPAKDS